MVEEYTDMQFSPAQWSKKIFVMCMHACTSRTLGAPGDQERLSESQNLVTDVCVLPNRGQEWDLNILQGKPGFYCWVISPGSRFIIFII